MKNPLFYSDVREYVKSGPYYRDNAPVECILSASREYHDAYMAKQMAEISRSYSEVYDDGNSINIVNININY